MNPSRKRHFLPVLILVILAALAGTALGRAGGGQSYGGGGGSSSGGGDGLGILVYFLIRLCIEQPCIGIPLVIVIIVIAVIVKRKRVKKQYSTIQQAGNRNLNQRQDLQARQNALSSLASRDPGFSESEFLRKARMAFIEVQKAWSDQDLSGIQRFISDGVMERFSLQVHMQKAMGVRNLMEDVQVLSAEITSIESDSHFDTLHVKFTAKAKDSDVDLETGRKLRNNYEGTFVEYWSFLRKPGASTLEGKSLVEGVCPNCGAHLELSESGRCGYCDAVVTSGEYDWVLAEITQSVEWSTSSTPSAIPGYAALAAEDPGFNTQTIEDTASVVFWRYVKSYFDNSADPMKKVASETFAESLEQSILQTRDGNSHLFFKDAAVGAVEVQDIVTGTEYDRVNVLVKWSAVNSWLDGNGKPRGSGPKTIRPQIFTLIRKHGVKTLVSQGLHSAHCQGCGAPYTGEEGGGCSYCGRPLNDGSGSWVLEGIKPFTGARINSARVSPVTGTVQVTPDVLLMAMAGVMYADGNLSGEEMEMLSSFAQHRGISGDRFDAVIASVRSAETPVPAPANKAEAMEVLKAMVRMSLADGSIDSSEKDLLEKYAGSAGMSRNVVSSTIAAQRRALYKEARKTAR